MKPRAMIVLIAALSIASAALAGGSPTELYTLNCWGCHKPRAEGIPGTVPRLANSMGDFLHVPGGREYLVEVPGVAASALSDAEIAAIIDYERGAWGNHGSLVAPTQVASERARLK